MFLAGLVSVATFVHFSGGLFCSSVERTGANVDHGLALAVVFGLADGIVLLLVRRRPRLLALAQLIGAAILVVAMVFVAFDSASYVAHRSCGLMTTTEDTIDERVYYLYVLWGVPAAFLAWSALHQLAPGGGRATGLGAPRLLGLLTATIGLAAWAFVESGSHARTTLPSGTHVFAEPNHDHVPGDVRYDHTPPAGGPHNDIWLNCGLYARPVRDENAVHSLEHGAVWITYAPQLARDDVVRLRRFVRSHYDGRERYLILSPYPGLGDPVVASAWGAQLRLRGAADPRLAAFVARFAGGDQGGETGGPCRGGAGSPIG
jgi:Protein of unknown function (DUF3105)